MTDPPRPLLITSDPALLDDLIRLATAAGVEMSVQAEPAVSTWSLAPLVFVGDDALGRTAARSLPRRESVIVLRRSHPSPADATPADTWRGAVALGAEHVAELPEGSRWIVDRMTQVADGEWRGGPVISCVSAAGGGGASTIAALLAREAHGLLVDLDPFGAAVPVDGGVRWPDLAETRGRIPPGSLREALPSVHGVHVLTGTPGVRFQIPVPALSPVLEAATRGFPFTAVDTPRADTDVSRIAWSRSDAVIIVAGPHPASAARVPALVEAIKEVCTEVAIVARTAPRDFGTWCLAEAHEWQLRYLPPMRHDRTLAQGEHAYLCPRTTARRDTRNLLSALAPGVTP